MGASTMRHGERRGPRRLAVAVILGLLAAGLAAAPTGGATAAGAPIVPTLRWTGCGAPYECATARVPLDYDNPGGPTIPLALTRLPASDPPRRIGTLFVNPGGPGGSGVELLRGGDAQEIWTAEVRARFDVVGFDPRGVGESAPIQCFATDEAGADFFSGTPGFPYKPSHVDPFIATYARYGRICLRDNGPIMRHLSTANVARDLDLLRRAVGDDRLTFDGASYGSFIGNVYANLFPRTGSGDRAGRGDRSGRVDDRAAPRRRLDPVLGPYRRRSRRRGRPSSVPRTGVTRPGRRRARWLPTPAPSSTACSPGPALCAGRWPRLRRDQLGRSRHPLHHEHVGVRGRVPAQPVRLRVSSTSPPAPVSLPPELAGRAYDSSFDVLQRSAVRGHRQPAGSVRMGPHRRPPGEARRWCSPRPGRGPVQPCATWPAVDDDRYLGPFDPDHLGAGPRGRQPVRPGHDVPRRPGGRRHPPSISPAHPRRAGPHHVVEQEPVHRRARAALPDRRHAPTGRRHLRAGPPALHAGRARRRPGRGAGGPSAALTADEQADRGGATTPADVRDAGPDAIATMCHVGLDGR